MATAQRSSSSPPAWSTSVATPNGSAAAAEAKRITTAHSPSEDEASDTLAAVSRLQPRVAYLLGIQTGWRRIISFCRLLSIGPCAWWGLRLSGSFLVPPMLWLYNGNELSEEARMKVTEALLAAIWCSASAYLAYFFTDRLLSRWLINYTKEATVVRLLTINSSFAYLTSWIVHLVGGSLDPRLLLYTWIGIATILTACYHYTQRKIPIHKETSVSISVFSIASFISMLALLLRASATGRVDIEQIPLVTITRKAAKIGVYLLIKILGVTPGDIPGNWGMVGERGDGGEIA
ncbi:N-glycosylation protein-domain-containing protein [Xylariaceae sp. FL0255]|nr:N-glycosylation protein-domain-containing protein [Xylariaceae sp. FL0255]